MRFTLTLFVVLWAAGASESPETPTDQAVIATEEWYAGNNCVQCHRAEGGRLAEMVDDWAKSVHYENKVPCQDCHGGDASLTREEVATDEEFKKAAHLTFKAEFLYLRDRVELGMVREGGISFACGECHRGSVEKRLRDPHAGPGAPPCLFGRDGGVSQTRSRGIAYICASCHPRAAEKHLGSAHGSFGVPSCLFCHGEGSHAMPAAGIDIIDPRPREELGRCSPCHTPENMTVVAKIRELREETAEMIATSAAQFEDLQQMGYRNLALAEMHAHVDDIQTNLREVLHGSDFREIRELSRSIKHVAKYTAYDHELVQALHEARQRQTRIALGAAGLLLVLAVMLVLYNRVFSGHAATGASPETARL